MDKMKKKILFVVPVLQGIGGIETSLLNLISNIDRELYDLDLCIYGNYVAFPDRIPNGIKIIPGTKEIEYCYVPLKKLKERLGFDQKIYMYLVKVWKKSFGIEKVIKMVKHKYVFDKYDIAISFANDAILDGIFVGGGNEIVRDCVQADRKLGWIHNEPGRCGCSREYYEKIYTNFDFVVNVSQECKLMFDEIVPSLVNKSRFVYNTFDIVNIQNKARKEKNPYNKDDFNIVTVSRMENNQKRIDRAIETCEILVKNGLIDFHWTMIGDGPDFEVIKQSCKEKGLDKYMTFTGKIANPYPFILNANIMIQPSDFEAYSMVLQESLILSTPIIVTDYSSAKEAVNDGNNGFIVKKDGKAIAEKLLELIENREKMQQIQSYIDSHPFTNEKALKQFYSLL